MLKKNIEKPFWISDEFSVYLLSLFVMKVGFLVENNKSFS